MILYEGKLSLICFILPSPLAVLYLFPHLGLEKSNVLYIDISNIWWLLFSYIAFINLIIFIVFSGYAYQVAVRATFLGSIFTSGVLVFQFLPDPWAVFGLYMCVMAFFHYSEFLTIAISNPRTLSIDSFILNHSNAYFFAAMVSWLEFFVEGSYYPEWKSMWPLSCGGLFLCISGECVRKVAMLTAQTNFNHVVQSVRHSDHQLVTHGIYSLCRHPSYVGWFYWSMGTQMILVNPICFVFYIISSLKFFNDRITVEEITLLNFFGEDYMKYQKEVPTGLPLIKGYRMEE